MAEGQDNQSIEVALYARYDKHADYITRYGNRTYADPMKLWGTSCGIKLAYSYPVSNSLKLKVGAGYYRLGIDKISRTSPWSSDVPSRTIDFTHPTGIDPVFHTNKYHYNNMDLSAGFYFEHYLNKNIALTAGADYTYYYTFSQQYRITYGNTKFKSGNSGTLGFGANASVGVLKKVKQERFYINPAMIIPVYQQIKGDRVFREDENIKINKWFNGLGISIAFGKFF